MLLVPDRARGCVRKIGSQTANIPKDLMPFNRLTAIQIVPGRARQLVRGAGECRM